MKDGYKLFKDIQKRNSDADHGGYYADKRDEENDGGNQVAVLKNFDKLF